MSNLVQLLQNAGNVAADLSALVQFGQWLQLNRDLLLLQLRAGSIDNVREMVREFLIEYPLAAGTVNWLMTNDVDTAIGAVALYDPALAISLRECRESFSNLQSEWKDKEFP